MLNYVFFKKAAFFLTALFIMVFYQCIPSASAGGSKLEVSAFSSVSAERWHALSTKKIFFGHHSVGDNIISGIKKIDQSSSLINLNIVKTMNPASISDAGIFAHGHVGRNFDPLSKIAAFKEAMDNGLGDKLDIAFMKFCFVDIGTESDLAQIFSRYRKTLNQLHKAYPNITFVHVTVPLYVEPSGIKTLIKQQIKKLLGKNNCYENTAKSKLNRMIRTEYLGREPVFDLAAFEATQPDGNKLTYTSDGLEYEALVPTYSSDGGHLNEAGQEVLAKALLTFLANLD